jgi:hypothetical protein
MAMFLIALVLTRWIGGSTPFFDTTGAHGRRGDWAAKEWESASIENWQRSK